MQKLILMLAALAVLVSACSPEAEGPVPFETVAQHAYSGHPERADYVIRSAQEWSALWEDVNSYRQPAPPLPEVDFGEELVIAVFQGAKSNGGYGIEIERVVATDASLEVIVRETSPEPGSIVTHAFTQPYHIVKVGKTGREVAFIRQ